MTTRKHFIVAAESVKANPDRVQARIVAEEFIKLFSRDNPRFDVDRFLTACGLE